MANTQFSGPVYSNNGFRVGSYYNSSAGNTVNAPVANVGASQIQALSVTAIADTNTVIVLPTGARVISFMVYVTTAFTGGSPTIKLGNAAGGAQYVGITALTAGVSILTIASTIAAAAGLLSFPGNLYVNINQSSAPTAVGAATLVINYAV